MNKYDFSVLSSWIVMIGMLYFIAWFTLEWIGVLIIGILSMITASFLFYAIKPIRMNEEDEIQKLINETNWDLKEVK
ncbi:MAG: hypothetical protein ACTSQ8_07800 [Candidatus Helarchaeota archaeon]